MFLVAMVLELGLLSWVPLSHSFRGDTSENDRCPHRGCDCLFLVLLLIHLRERQLETTSASLG